MAFGAAGTAAADPRGKGIRARRSLPEHRYEEVELRDGQHHPATPGPEPA